MNDEQFSQMLMEYSGGQTDSESRKRGLALMIGEPDWATEPPADDDAPLMKDRRYEAASSRLAHFQHKPEGHP